MGRRDRTADISVDGYAGKAFQRTAPAEFTGCSTSFAPFRSWENEDPDGSKGWSYYDPGRGRDLVGPRRRRRRSSSSTRGCGRTIRRPPTLNSPPCSTRSASTHLGLRCSAQPLSVSAWTYFVDEVDGSPTPRIFITLGDGWSTEGGWGIEQRRRLHHVQPTRLGALGRLPLVDGFDPGPLTTLDGLVIALSEQRDGSTSPHRLRSLSTATPGQSVPTHRPRRVRRPRLLVRPVPRLAVRRRGLSYYSEGEVETLWVLDVDGEIIIINTRTGSDHRQPARRTRRHTPLDPHRPGLSRPARLERMTALPPTADGQCAEYVQAPRQRAPSNGPGIAHDCRARKSDRLVTQTGRTRMNIEPNPTVATSARTRRTVLRRPMLAVPVLIAVLAGSAVGVERHRRHRPGRHRTGRPRDRGGGAGRRTHHQRRRRSRPRRKTSDVPL